MIADYRQRLIAARTALGLSERQMAERLLTPWQTYQQWERGLRRTPGVAVVAAESLQERFSAKTRGNPARNQEIKALLLQGTTTREIAGRFGLSRQRVYQIAAHDGISPSQAVDFRQAAAVVRVRAAARKKERREVQIAEFRRLVEEEGLSIGAAAIRMEIPKGRAQAWVTAHGIKSRHRSRNPAHRRDCATN